MFWIVLSGIIAFMIFVNLAFMAYCLVRMKGED